MFSDIGIGYATILIFGSMIVFLVLGMPLGFLTGFIAVAAAYLWFGDTNVLSMVGGRIVDFTTSYAFVAVPMYVLMASLLDKTGIAKDLYNAMRIVGGRLPGGVALQSMLVAVVLAAMSGIIGGETVLLGMVALPQMLRLGYNQNLAIGTCVAGGALGTMVPPSIVLIVYGLSANVSVGDLFLAAVPPALLLAGLYMTYILVLCWWKPSYGPPMKSEELAQLTRADYIRIARDIAIPGMLVLWVLGSIYGGIASVTESACVGVAAVLLAAAYRRELSIGIVYDTLKHTMRTVGMIIWVGIGATMIIGVYNLMGGDKFVQQLIIGQDVQPVVVILIMMGILLILGCFLDWIGIALLCMPIFVPIVVKLGYDPIWFGVLFCINMQVAFLTPPFGSAAFYLKSVAPPGIELTHIFRAVWPFIFIQLTVLAILVAFPDVALFVLK
ncbi:TRAP transporter large permease subunit [Xanthobacteraceae bacterium Astr-EGSB]|uniref:TRAP transporter large permease n=1 Tax=Astrobacterium formosum TaxID=3069710 RepID=UPI0027B4D4D6|nr:TRAP transporter large permease subunit [Xanthobacteraceae bacterium Astr-EGSB]